MGGKREWQVQRRKGEFRLSERVRQRLHRLATSNLLKTRPKLVCVKRLAPASSGIAAERLCDFLRWHNKDAFAGQRRVADGEAVQASVALSGRVAHSDVLWALLCFWRISCLDSWKAIEDSVLARDWPTALLSLRRRQQQGLQVQSSEHQTYVAMQCPGPEQHIAFMRYWDNVSHKLELRLPRRLAPASSSRGGLRQRAVRTCDVAASVSRLQAVGQYTSKNIENSLRLAGLARHCVGTIGPGSMRACVFLLGFGLPSRMDGLWPWDTDSRNCRGVVAEVAKQMGGTWVDAQNALCFWWKTKPEERLGNRAGASSTAC